MTDLKTTFAGLQLKNPIIISSSGLTNSAGKNKKLAEAGAGAIVLKSLFEEQILIEADQLKDPTYSEGNDYLADYIREHKLAEYLELIKESKKVCDIPIIASINCYTDTEWIDFAKQMEEAGADALEINILAVQSDIQYKYGSFEQRHIDILSHIKKVVKIPVIMKLGDNLTNPVALIDQLYANGAAAVVLFNRFYQPDIDIEKMEHISGNVFSSASDLSKTLRWVGIASSMVDKIDYAASGGVHKPAAVVKAILAGASAVEVCSTIYQNTNMYIGEMTRFLATWMEQKGVKFIFKRCSLHQYVGTYSILEILLQQIENKKNSCVIFVTQLFFYPLFLPISSSYPTLQNKSSYLQIREQYPSLLLQSSSDRTYNSFQLNSGYALLLHHNHTRGR